MINIYKRKLNALHTSIVLLFCGTALIGCNSGSTATTTNSNDKVKDKIIFVTTGDYSGNLNGVSGADSICQSEAYQAGSVIEKGYTFKAVILSSTRYPCNNAGVCGPLGWSDWPITADTHYRTAGSGAFIFASNANGIFDNNYGQYFDPITEATSYYNSNPNFWSGINGILVGDSVGYTSVLKGWSFANESNNWDISGSSWSNYANLTCNDWYESSNNLMGSQGDNSRNSNYSTSGLSPGAGYSTLDAAALVSGGGVSRWVTGTNQSCSQKLPLICVQQ